MRNTFDARGDLLTPHSDELVGRSAGASAGEPVETAAGRPAWLLLLASTSTLALGLLWIAWAEPPDSQWGAVAPVAVAAAFYVAWGALAMLMLLRPGLMARVVAAVSVVVAVSFLLANFWSNATGDWGATGPPAAAAFFLFYAQLPVVLTLVVVGFASSLRTIAKGK